MAVPKKRTGHSAQGHRRSNWKATKPELTKCPNCGAAVLTHTVCTACGTYKGQPVSLKDRKDDAASTTSVKKSSKKTENVEEIKVEESKTEVKAEEVKEITAEEKTEEKAVEAVEEKTSEAEEKEEK